MVSGFNPDHIFATKFAAGWDQSECDPAISKDADKNLDPTWRIINDPTNKDSRDKEGEQLPGKSN